MTKEAKILVVEDESIVAMDIKMRLTGLGYSVVGLASTSEQALQLETQTDPDLILMDIKIKGPKDGIETAEKIRTRRDVPIIFITAFADEPTLQRAKVTTPSGYILKPFQERELAIAIDMALYKHKMEKALRESEERYMLAIRGANDGIWDWDLRQNRAYFSQRWKEIIGYQEDEIGNSLEEWLSHVHSDDRDRLQLALNHHLDGLTAHLECEVRMLHKDGSTRWVLVRGLAVADGNQRAYRIAGSISDISALKQAQEQLIYDAYHDSLTGIPNRALFLDRLEQAMERHKRYHQDGLTVLFLDLDNFKVINDRLGHQTGDKMLIQVAQRLQNLIRASDTVARLGGDEFVILLESTPGNAYARNVAERIEEMLDLPIKIEGHEVSTTASIGIVVVSNDHHLQASDVLRDADIAMYRAKSMGKDRHEVFDILYSQKAAERLDIENCLQGALERGDFHLNFQPIYSFPNRQIVGVEALLRLIPSEHAPIPPSVFIPIAEEIGIFKEIGDWVLVESCQKMSDWHKRFPNESHLDLHVNLSVKQIHQPDFAKRLKEILDQTGLDPSRLKLEMTENVFTENIEQIAIVLDQLALMGIKLLIDDFGTGYSSLGYIRRFPISTIKLDRTFIFPARGNDSSTEIVKAILTMASQLGLTTVAEGIETEEQADYLMDLKCHFGQGFLFSRPLEMHMLENLFEKNERER
jgi:diguanylate cyclase (GGDEF)-like protein/PAS domain S-box-containing protein